MTADRNGHGPASPEEAVRRPRRSATRGIEADRRVRLTPASEIRSEAVLWLWREYIPLRGITVLAGEKGAGKSTLAGGMLAAAVSCGTLPGDLYDQPSDVLVASAEDSWASVVKPRLVAHDADLDRVHRLGIDGGAPVLNLPDDVEPIEIEIERFRDEGLDARMLVVDPIGAFLSDGIDTNRDASVRRALAPLAGLAERLDLAVIVVAHVTKDTSRRAIERITGAYAFVNAARAVLTLARDPVASDLRDERRVLVQLASNWGRVAPSRAFSLEQREIRLDDGSRATASCLRDLGEVDIDAEDLRADPQRRAADEAETTIRAALVSGPLPRAEVKRLAQEAGCADRTVDRAAAAMRGRGELVSETVPLPGRPHTASWRLAVSAGETAETTPHATNDDAIGAIGTIGGIGGIGAFRGNQVLAAHPHAPKDNGANRASATIADAMPAKAAGDEDTMESPPGGDQLAFPIEDHSAQRSR